ncbi:galactokinase [Candidatus Desantisbacteria bacterium CG_4_10_14_0_8_um_filter_48_22]|uniref:Galactokinase n=1 Tax=Candidatus Desantisbacteria bacterium CG_4_10_14_0_8_um_filter_48_22 TaxID=1974543 RepID=A0A2M7SCW7_9BACT|nr:MAG: galactokinase [Candidatus Desantisbacteria bacterium CG_4_10_14_0_8_um_filter_48_22]
MERKETIKIAFKEEYGAEPQLIASAPGRINLIGEHTDYNEGYVLPAAINRDILYAVNPRDDRVVRIFSLNFDKKEKFSLEEPLEKKKNWSDYIKGVISMFLGRGARLKGMDIVVWGNVPIGSGLSSSAAMEVGMAVVLQKLNNLNFSPPELIKMSQRAENEFVGVSCGIMDQFISCLGRKGSAIFLDCRSLEYEYIPLNLGDIRIAIIDTKIKRELAASAYNQRRGECAQGVELLRSNIKGIRSLRDVTTDDFNRYKASLPPVIAKRCEHVVFENKRVLDSLELLREGEMRRFGRLLYDSHESLKDLYEVSCAELDLIVDTAREVKGTFGCRMTGGGFGGCAIALVKESSINDFVKLMEERYSARTGKKPEIYVCETQNGALNS